MQWRSTLRHPVLLVFGFLCAVASCSVTIRNPRVTEASVENVQATDSAARAAAAAAAALPGAATRGPPPRIAKLHLHDGELVVLQSWTLLDSGTISGIGIRYDVRRVPRATVASTQVVSLDSVALLETDHPESAVALSNAARNVWTVAWGAATVLCAMDPKSCFGSCPTFYVEGVDTDRPRAEGFSSSIARIREATDVDDLGLTRSAGTSVKILMRNEAWETHAVRWVRLLAVPTVADADIVASVDGRFHALQGLRPPASCAATAGDCRAAVAARDAVEWHDLTDASDLTRPDTMELVFSGSPSRPALVLSARQSFVSTFVLYETMAWLGNAAGDWLARLERGDPQAVDALDTVERLIGTVRVEQRTAEGAWEVISVFREAGPIAIDRQVVPLRADVTGAPVRLRLIFAKGNWRVDEARLGSISQDVVPLVIEPEAATRGGASVREVLIDSARYHLAFPGDEVAVTFEVPTGAPRYALFLESRGHYYEWMRGEWIAEQDLSKVAMLMRDPNSGLRLMAPMYKAREAAFEASFWASRFGGTVR